MENQHKLRKYGNEIGLQWPYPGLTYPFSFAREIGCMPNYEKIKKEDPELHEVLANTSIIYNTHKNNSLKIKINKRYNMYKK